MDVRIGVREFCQKLSGDIGTKLEKADDESESGVLLTVYQDKCKGIISSLEDSRKDKLSEAQITSLWKDIAKLILDVTYIEEITLVADEFPEDSAENRMKYILESFSGLEMAITKIHNGKDIVEYLGPEIVECIQWRRGALMYMFCHTIQNRLQASSFPTSYIHYLEDGINYLVKMFKTRCDPQWLKSPDDTLSPSDCHSDEKDTLQLIEQGIFSDTHLLALMYCGELCFWYSSACCVEDKNKQEPTTKHGNEKLVSQSPTDEDSSEDSKKSSAIFTPVENCGADEEGGETQPSDRNEGLFKDVKVSNEPSEETTFKSDKVNDKHFNYVAIGNSVLKKYLHITNGPMAGGGWNSNRADEILIYFDKLKL